MGAETSAGRYTPIQKNKPNTIYNQQQQARVNALQKPNINQYAGNVTALSNQYARYGAANPRTTPYNQGPANVRRTVGATSTSAPIAPTSTGAMSSPVSMADIPAPVVPSEAEFQAGDTTYLEELGGIDALDKARKQQDILWGEEFTKQKERGVGDFEKGKKSFYEDLARQFAARGTIGSGVYRKATGAADTSFKDQLGRMNEDFLNQENEYGREKKDYFDELERRKGSALKASTERYKAKYGV